MKALFYLLPFYLISNLSLQAQSDTTNFSPVIPYKIEVTNKATTVIIFPFSVIDADCGTSELRAEKIRGITNIIKIKTTCENMQSTNLHVFTADGQVHVFDVSWRPSPAITTYDLRQSQTIGTPVLFNSTTNEKEVKEILEKVKIKDSFLHRSKRRFQMVLTLQGIYLHDQLLVLRFRIHNLSQLSYTANWTRLYISDKKLAKRSSVQELPVIPVYKDELPNITGESSQQWMIIIPKITIPNKKQLTFELQEKNGGRHLTLTIKNKHLFKAITI
jgi:conjugative transposon TraN protein